MKRHLIYNDNASDKFWKIETAENSFNITYGRTGSSGQTLNKTFSTVEACREEAEKLINEKLKKGYQENTTQESPVKNVSKKKEKIPVAKRKTDDADEVDEKLLAVSLYYQNEGSDKVYQVGIEKAEGGFVVNFSFGRRGSTLKSGTKTSKPVAYQSAYKILAQIINEKKAKGYTEGISGTPYVQTSKEERISGVNCQLANPIADEELEVYISNDLFGVQEKMDGNRTLIRKEKDRVDGINRKGLIIALPQSMHNEALALSEDFIIDGEAIGDKFYTFDILALNSDDLKPLPYLKRYAMLIKLLKDRSESIFLLELFTTVAEKKQLIKDLQHANREGVVFKNLQAPYIAGRPSSKGTQLKYKFYETATVCVEKVNLKRSVSMRVLEDKTWVSIGNVTIPPNVEIPETNDIIEVRYLYAYKGGSLYQPTYLGKRTDADEQDCMISQLKYKVE